MIQPVSSANQKSHHAQPAPTPVRQRRLTLVTFGFKYGAPGTNYYFDVSFLQNPARQSQWGLFSKPCADMRRFLLDQPEAQRFLDALVPMIDVLLDVDDDVRVGLGCSSGRHRSYIMAEELRARLEDDQTNVRLIHREEQYQ